MEEATPPAGPQETSLLGKSRGGSGKNRTEVAKNLYVVIKGQKQLKHGFVSYAVIARSPMVLRPQEAK